MNAHAALCNALRIELSRLGCVTILNVTGMFWRKTDTGYVPVRVGHKGWADIIGFTNQGRFIAIEAKTGTGRLSPEQQNFRDVVRSHNGIFIEARSISDLEILKK